MLGIGPAAKRHHRLAAEPWKHVACIDGKGDTNPSGNLYFSSLHIDRLTRGGWHCGTGNRKCLNGLALSEKLIDAGQKD